MRANYGVPIMRRNGVTADQDFISPEDIRSSPYYQNWVEGHDCRYFAGIGLTAGQEFWCVSIQRTIAQGAFERDQLAKLAMLCRLLSDAATLSRHLGFARVLGMADALQMTVQAAIVFDDRGRVLVLNSLAETSLAP